MAALLLASASSRRKALLDQIDVAYQSASMDIDESVQYQETPYDYVFRLAQEKAQAGVRRYPDKVVLAADTTVVANGKILGKPENEFDAQAMLKSLSNSSHQVLTAIAIAQCNQEKISVEAHVITTTVYFSELSDQQIEQYIKTREPMDKAGAYGIQGKAALFISRIEGSYSNVVGLPLAETGALLQRYGIPVW